MIDYETYCRIKQLSEHEQLSVTQIARTLSIDVRTVTQWLAEPRYRPRRGVARASKLDAFKPTIRRLLEHHPYSAAQLIGRLTEDGYTGGISILKDYIRTVRPPRKPAFLTLAFAPGECAQVDWGHYGSIAVGNTRRKLSFFVMVLAYSRMMYLEFTVSQTMEHFLACHQNAFEYFDHRVPGKPSWSTTSSPPCCSASPGQAPVFNPRYLDFAQPLRLQNRRLRRRPRQGKRPRRGRRRLCEKELPLRPRTSPTSTPLNPAAQHWLDTVANRAHPRRNPQTTRRELFKLEKPLLRPISANLYDIGIVHNACASNRFRVTFETNRYSVPAEYASQRLTLKAYPERICIYHDEKLIARHPRSYDRHRDFEDPDHPRHCSNSGAAPAITNSCSASSPCRRKPKPTTAALAAAPAQRATSRAPRSSRSAEIYGTEATARALDDAPRLRGLQLRVHRQSARVPRPRTARAGRVAPHPARRPARTRTTRTRSRALRHRRRPIDR